MVVDELTCRFNPAHLGVIGDFGRGVSRFSSFGKNPSPRIPWFDTLRVNCHGRFRITAKILKGHLASSNSPYTKTSHFTDVRAENVLMVASRMKPSEREPFPISWELNNWHIQPLKFNDERQSDIVFDFVRVGLTPVPECDSGDPQDHYFIPFPTKAEVKSGGPGIGRGAMEMINAVEPVAAKMNPLGCFTTWWTGLHKIPGFDSYAGFKTRRMTLGIDVCIRHPKAMQPGLGVLQHNSSFSNFRDHQLHYIPKHLPDNHASRHWVPPGASVLHSDGLTTLIKVIKNLVRRPISCRLAPRMVDHARKPASKTGLSSSLVALNVTMNVSDVNVMLYNNLEPGHGLFVSLSKFTGELGKETTITFDANGDYYRDSKICRRRVELQNLNTSIRMPNLDLAGDETGTGRLLSVARVFLSDDVKDESQYAASPRLKAPYRVLSTGFGSDSHDKSPFYTFSASHSLQREKKLDKVKHDVRIAVDDVRLLWSPARRTSIWAWPDALKEKTFAMKASPTQIVWPKAEGDTSEEGNGESPVRPNFENGFKDRGVPTTVSALAQSASSFRRSDNDVCQKMSSIDSNDSDINSMDSSVIHYNIPKRTASAAVRPPEGSMVDILDKDFSQESGPSSGKEKPPMALLSLNVKKTLETIPKFEFLINSSQLCIGSPETAGLVFVTSDAARIGIVDKRIEQTRHTGRNDIWVDREHRVHLKESNVYCQSTGLESFDFGASNWVPKDAKDIAPLTRVTTKPVSMDLMYISSTRSDKENMRIRKITRFDRRCCSSIFVRLAWLLHL